MKKFLAILLSVVMLVSVVLPGTALAAGEDAVFTLSNVSGNPGATVDVKVSLKTVSAVNSVALSGIEYDADVLEFVGFADYEHLETLMPIENFVDVANKTIMAPLKATAAFDGAFCTLQFKIKDTAVAGNVTITANSVVKNGPTPVTATVKAATVSVVEKPKEDMKGVTLSNATFTYDGTEKSLEVKGAPAGASVVWENNGMTKAGTYEVKATVSAAGYNTKTLSAKLVINKAGLTVTGMTAANKKYDGTNAAVISGGQLKGVIGDDDVSVSFPTSGTFAKKDAGKNITVNIANLVLAGADKDNYTLTQPSLNATIEKAPLEVTADSFSIALGAAAPSLTYKIVNGKLYGNDKLNGALKCSVNVNKEGTYDILQGNLSAGSNYDLKYNKGTVTVSAKTEQQATVSVLPEVVYGETETVTVTATPDATSKLANFTYESSNPEVAEISATGVITIKAAGETVITVKEPGDDTYAEFVNTQTLVVKQKAVTITSINLDEMSAVIDGLYEDEVEQVDIDLSKIKIEIISTEADIATVKVSGILLSGALGGNYAVATESIETTIATDKLATVTVETENGSVSGAGVYIKGTQIVLTATADTGYRFSGWFVGETQVSNETSYSIVVDADLTIKANFVKKSSGGGGSASLPLTGDKNEEPKDEPEVVVPSTPVETGKFVDLGNHQWAKDAIEKLADQGIIKGVTANTFAPANNITRADYAALIVRLFDLSSDNAENFSDVDASDYFAAELAVARNTGVVAGKGNNMFAPRENISRQDMMVMIYRAMTALEIELKSDVQAEVSDLDAVSDYAKEAVSALMASGIVNGKNGKVDPMANATRAEVAVMLERILAYIQ